MRQHIQHIKVKCNSRLNLFRCLTSTCGGADRATLLRLYKAIVLPIIEYGAVVYAGGTEKALHSLETAQNSFIRIALGVMKTSPVSALQVESNIPPLSIRRRELSLRYFSKIKQFPEHASRAALNVLPNIHHNYIGPSERRSGLTIASRVNVFCQELQFRIPDITPLPALILSPWKLQPRSVSFLYTLNKKDVSQQEAQQLFQLFREEHLEYQFIFTDGSKENDRTGNGIVVEGIGTIKGRLPNDTSVYIAELHAILIALRLSRVHNIRKVCICSDSKSALQSIINPNFTQHLHFDIANIHEELYDSGTEIIFLWVPGHTGILGNEQADQEAKAALALPEITVVPINYHSIKSSISKCSTLFWQGKWRDDQSRTQLHEIKPNIGQWTSCNRPNRIEEKALARMRLGHTQLTHSYIYSKSRRPVCNTCHCILTIRHLLLFCDDFQNQRRVLKDYCTVHNIPFSLSVLLGDDYPDLIRLLFRFLTDSNILTRL